MPYKIKLSKIPLFQFVSPNIAKKIPKSFKIVKKNKDEGIVNYNEEMPGLFIIVTGGVEMFTEGFKTHLASLGPGCSFGEISLIDNQKASASIRASEDQTRLLLCEKERFMEIIANDFVFTAAFYKGAAQLLATRIRTMNKKIEEEITKSQQLVNEMLESGELLKKMAKTRSNINITGENMIEKLSEILVLLDEMESNFPEQKEVIGNLKKIIEPIILIDSQNYDIISQQIDMINQYIINIQKLVTQQGIDEIKGDQNIFTMIDINSEEDNESAVTFF